MKKRISLVLALVLLLVLLAVPGSAVSFDTLAVQTGTNTYTFHVGDTFTYSYWVRLAPDVANYGETYINERMGSLGVGIPLGTLLQEFLNQRKLKNISNKSSRNPPFMIWCSAHRCTWPETMTVPNRPGMPLCVNSRRC